MGCSMLYSTLVPIHDLFQVFPTGHGSLLTIFRLYFTELCLQVMFANELLFSGVSICLHLGFLQFWFTFSFQQFITFANIWIQDKLRSFILFFFSPRQMTLHPVPASNEKARQGFRQVLRWPCIQSPPAGIVALGLLQPPRPHSARVVQS